MSTAAYHREWHHRTKNARKDKIKAIKLAAIRRNAIFIREYLREHPCIDCGKTDPVVLEFDHVTGTKRAKISKLVMNESGIALIQEEMLKCAVRCANCHRRKTAIEQGWYKYLGT